jgi:hypothetical protein
MNVYIPVPVVVIGGLFICFLLVAGIVGVFRKEEKKLPRSKIFDSKADQLNGLRVQFEELSAKYPEDSDALGQIFQDHQQTVIESPSGQICQRCKKGW